MTDILVNGAEALLNLLISEAINEIGLVWGVNGEVKKLKSVVEKIQEVVEDAEKKQVDDVGVSIGWQVDLEEVAYDADDILDEIAYESLQRKMEGRNSCIVSIDKVQNFLLHCNSLAFHLKTAHTIRDINSK
ncbi:hypothetical protein Syun_006564 [Stephania yunnanensis]|uniref:Disease resistance N-terminal domain-containing protein n=1 Tax=Stephania yunnanensis TaxID=152371 RepID=A0AAP0PXQ1_9MAGN